ncbi:hypothetical protein TNCV_1433091 [Trichonephila clavipes]|nr:hypothetical protein TNCV_1433091 [Trichonephila clavipes]
MAKRVYSSALFLVYRVLCVKPPCAQCATPLQQAATAHKTFGPPDLTSTYSVCTRRVFGGVGHQTRPSSLESDALTIRLPKIFENTAQNYKQQQFTKEHQEATIAIEVGVRNYDLGL